MVNQYMMKNIYNKNKIKIKSYEGKISTDFHDNGIPKKGSCCISLSIVLIDSLFKIGKNYYPQVSLEECKYIVKEKKRQAITLVTN